MSTSTLRRREGDLLKPIVGPDGVHLFDESEVRSVMVTVRRRQAVAALGPSNGDAAADVFTLLDEGEHPVEIVKRLRLAPDVVVSLRDQWAQMRNAFVVNADQARELGRLSRTPPPSDATSAVAHIEQRLEPLTQPRRGNARCSVCGEATASTCEACIVTRCGPLGTLDVRVERRGDEGGSDEVRVLAEVYWNDPVGDGGNIAELRSEWYSVAATEETPIHDVVGGVERLRRARG